MPVLGSIKYPGSTHLDIPDSFLKQSDVDELVNYAKSFEFDTQINESAIDVITNSSGLDTNSFNVDGRTPLNEVSTELLKNMISCLDVFRIQADAIQSRGYFHVYNEAAENYFTVLEEYQKRLDDLKKEVETYNNLDNSTYSYVETDSDGNSVTKYGLCATVTLSYDLTTAPTLTFNEGTGAKGTKEFVLNYNQVIANYNYCNNFYDTYVIDAIELKDKCSACKPEDASYDIDKKINALLNQEEKPLLTGEVQRGIPRELTGEELEKFMEDNFVHDIEGLKVYCEIVTINGVEFKVYQVIDPNNFDQTMYDTYVENSLMYISAIDSNVLAFISSNDTDLIYYSSYYCDDMFYDRDGNFKGDEGTLAFAREGTTNVYMIAVPENMDNYGYSGIIHELGHALDYALQDQAGRQGIAGQYVDEIFEVSHASDRNYNGEYTYNGKNFYEIATEEISQIMDPTLGGSLGVPEYEYGTYPDEGNYNWDFSYYGEEKLIEDTTEHYGVGDDASDYFAEAFSAYYSLDPEKRERYRFLIPETFGYMDQLVNNL